MKKFKVIMTSLCFLLSFIFLTSCGSASGNNASSGGGNTEEQNKGKAALRVGMVITEPGLGDKSFNDAAYLGLTRAKEDFNIELQVLESKQDSELPTYLDRISKNSDVVVGVGYRLKDAVDTISKQNPNVKYVLIDDEVQGENVYNLGFREEEGSFLAGALAGLTTKTNKVGFVGGTDTSLIRKFEAGFIAGVKSVNAEAGKLLEEGTTSKYVGNFSDTAKGYEIAKSLYNDGVDIIYHAAASAGIGVFKAAQETPGNYGIGVDQDQSITLPEYSDVILTSMVKNLDSGVYNFIQDYLNNGFKAGTVRIGLKDQGVYLTENVKDKVSQEVLDKIEELKNKIISGEIVVPTTIEELKNFGV